MRGQVLIAVSALALAAFAQPASAQQYRSYGDEYAAQSQACQQSHANRTLGGAAIGGVAGAVIGNNATSRGHHDRGSLVGGIAGAILGGIIGNSTAREQPQCQGQVSGNYDPYYGQAQPGYDDGKYADNRGDDGYADDNGYPDDDSDDLDGDPGYDSGK